MRETDDSGGRQWNNWEGDAEYNAAQQAAAERGTLPDIADPGVDLTANPDAEPEVTREEALEAVGGRPADRALEERERREEAAAMRDLEQQQRDGARASDEKRRQAAHDAKKAEKPAEDAVKRETRRSDKKS